MESSDPAKTVLDSMYHNVAARCHAVSGGTLPIQFVRVGNVHRQVESASGVLSVQEVKAFRSFMISYSCLGAIRIPPNGNRIGANFLSLAKERHSMCTFANQDVIRRPYGNVGNREPRIGGERGNTQNSDSVYS